VIRYDFQASFPSKVVILVSIEAVPTFIQMNFQLK
jgi:hypothetical protein